MQAGVITAADITGGGANPTAGSCVNFGSSDGIGRGACLMLGLAGTFVATMQVEGSLDGVAWDVITGRAKGSTSPVTSFTAAGKWVFDVAGYTRRRVRCTSFTSGAPAIWQGVTDGPPAEAVAAMGGGGAVTIAAGEAHIGEVGTPNVVVTPSITVNTAAYSAGNTVGGKLALAGAVRVSGGVAVLESLHIVDAGNQKAAFDILLFDADPSAATTTDHAAFAWSTDIAKCKGHVAVATGDYVTVDGKAVCSKKGIGLEIKAAAGTSLWAVIVTSGSPDYVAATDLQVSFGFLQG